MSWIRWPGLVAFAVVVALLIAGVKLVAPWAIEHTIESAGSEAAGALMEVADVDISLLPLGIEVEGITVADADAPMANAVEIGRLAATVEVAPLLWRKVVVDELTGEAIRFNTPRERSGALPGATAPETGGGGEVGGAAGPAALPKLPTAKEILAREHLDTLDAAAKLKAEVAATRARWEERIATLPDADKLAAYRSRLEAVRGRAKQDPIGTAAEAKRLADEIRADAAQIRTARADLTADLQRLKEQAAAVQAAPAKDAARLKAKYAPSAGGLGNATRTLLGPGVADPIDKVLTWYRRLAPYLGGGAGAKEEEAAKPTPFGGRNIALPDREPLPDLLVRTAHLSLELDFGKLTGEIHDLTTDPPRLGRPTTFAFAGDHLKGAEAARISGILDHLDPTRPRDSAQVALEGLVLAGCTLGAGAMPVAVAAGRAGGEGHLTIAGKQLHGGGDAKLDGLKLTTEGSGEGSGIAARALSGVDHLALRVEIDGTLDDPAIRLSSDLDRLLGDAVGREARAQAAKLESRLKSAIGEQVKGPIGEATGGLGGLGDLDAGLGDRLKGLTDLSGEAGRAALPGGSKRVPGVKLPGKLKIPGF